MLVVVLAGQAGSVPTLQPPPLPQPMLHSTVNPAAAIAHRERTVTNGRQGYPPPDRTSLPVRQSGVSPSSPCVPTAAFSSAGSTKTKTGQAGVPLSRFRDSLP